MNGWEAFNRYVGVQGILALALLAGYLYASMVQIVLPEGYTPIMTTVFGFYFAKNGRGIIDAVKGQ